MATRVGYVGTESTGDVLTKANFDKGPGGLVAYNSITTNFGPVGSGSVTGVSGLSPAITAGTNRTYKITIGHAITTLGGTGSATADFIVYNNTAGAGIASATLPNFAVGANYPGSVCITTHQPGAGTINYLFAILVTAITGSPSATLTIAASGAAARTAYILVEDVGPQF